MNTIKECFNIILKGGREESRAAARKVKKILYSNSGEEGQGKYLDIKNAVNEAPFEYINISEEWRQENFVMAISVIYFLRDKEIDYDLFFSWMLQLLQHGNGNIRYAAVRMLETDIGPLTFHIRCPEYKHSKEKCEKADNVLHSLFLNLNRLSSSLLKPEYKRYKYIDSLPTSPYKSVQMVLSSLRESYNEEYFESFIPSNKSKDDYYFDAMDYLCEGNADHAIKLLNKAMELDKHYLAGYFGLASAYLEKGDMKSHEKYVNEGFAEVKKIYPKWPDECSWGILENRPVLRLICYKAALEHSLGNLKEADQLYRLLLRLNPCDNQGVRYLIAAMFAGFKPDYTDELMDKGNKKQDWSELEDLLKEQNEKHKFWDTAEDDE